MLDNHAMTSIQSLNLCAHDHFPIKKRRLFWQRMFMTIVYEKCFRYHSAAAWTSVIVN